MRNQELFNYLSREHGLTPLEGEMHEIELIVVRTLANDRAQEAARSSQGFVPCSEWVCEAGAALSKQQEEWTRRVARTVAALREWRTLEYIGYFIDLSDEQKKVVVEVAERTNTLLNEWGYSYEAEPRPSHTEKLSDAENNL